MPFLIVPRFRVRALGLVACLRTIITPNDGVVPATRLCLYDPNGVVLGREAVSTSPNRSLTRNNPRSGAAQFRLGLNGADCRSYGRKGGRTHHQGRCESGCCRRLHEDRGDRRRSVGASRCNATTRTDDEKSVKSRKRNENDTPWGDQECSRKAWTSRLALIMRSIGEPSRLILAPQKSRTRTALNRRIT